MKEDYILLKFTTTENVPLLIGDYVDLTDYITNYDHDKFNDAGDYTTKLFIVDRNYFPSYDSNTGGWVYNVQINAYYYLWENKILKYDPENASAETAINLTDTIDKHLQLVTKSLQAAGLKYYDSGFGVDVDGEVSAKGVKFITYDSVSILGALNLIADAYECEWWIDTTTIHLGYRKIVEGDKHYKGEIPLLMHEQIKSASTSKGNNTYANRLYAFGGTVNVPTHYRDAIDFTVSSAGENFVYDEKKPIKTSLFIDTTEAPIERFTFREQKTDHGVYEEYIGREEFNLGSFDLLAQKYNITTKEYNPYIKFVKVIARGGIDTTFSVKLNCKLVLSSGSDEVVIRTGNVVITNSSLSSLNEYALGSTQSQFSGTTGYIGPGGTFRVDALGNESVYLHGHSSTEDVVVAAVKVWDKKDRFCPFCTTTWSSLNRNDTWCQFLTPYESHTDNIFYAMFCNKMYNNIVTQGSNQSYAKWGVSLPKHFKFSDDGREEFTFTKDGKYDLKLVVEVVSHSGLAIYHNGSNPVLVYDTVMPDFEMTLQRAAQKKDTYIKYKKEDGTLAEANVTINPNFRDDNHAESSLIQFEGVSPLNVGDVFQFPEIIRTRVAEEYGEWFTPSTSSGVKGGVVQKNLMLPEGTPYIQSEDVSDDDAVEGIVVYDWIYPTADMEVREVIPYMETVKDENAEATTNDEKVKRWAIRVSAKNKEGKDIAFHKDVFEPNKDTYMIFQNGKCSGLKFKVEWMKDKTVDGEDGNDITLTTQDFKLEPNTDWGEELPKETYLPSVGDKLIVDGLYVEYFDFGLIEAAEERLKQQAEKDYPIMSKENVVVDVTLRNDVAYGMGRIQLGAEVNIKDVLKEEFPSRVIGFEEKLDYPYDSPKYFVSDGNYYSKLGEIDSKISAVQKESFAFNGNGGGGNSISIITNADNYTRPSERNVFSANRVEQRFLHTDVDDVADGNIEFKKDVAIGGKQTVGGAVTIKGDTSIVANATIHGNEHVRGNSTIEGSQDVRGNVRLAQDETIGGTLRILPRGSEDEPNNAIVIGDYLEEGDIIQGAKISKDGIASFAAIKTPSMQVYELEYNRETAVQGEFVFSDGDTVESVTYVCADGTQYTSKQVGYEEFTPTYTANENGGGSWNFSYIRLGLKMPYEGYVTTFEEYDILYANINNIGESGGGARTGKCFMRVLANNEIEGVDGVAENGTVLNVILYADKETPSGKNMLPSPCMVITRHGNEVDEKRQDIFLISSEYGRLAQLTGVDSPIVKHDTSYGVVLGRLPYSLIQYIKNAGYSNINETHPYLYTRGAIIQDLIMLDYRGKVIKSENYRGNWNQAVANGEIEGESKYASTDTMYDTVTHKGSLWMCNENETTEEPRGGINAWLLKVAKGDDSEAVSVYSLTTDPTIVYVRTDNTMTAESVSVKVGVSTIHGFSYLDSEELLAENNMKVYYSVNGGSRQEFSTFGIVQCSWEYEYISFYLVDTETGMDIYSTAVPFIHETKDGKDGVLPTFNMLNDSAFEDISSDGTVFDYWDTELSPSTTLTLIASDNSGIGENAIHLNHNSTRTASFKALTQQLDKATGTAWYTFSFYAKDVSGSNRKMTAFIDSYRREESFNDGTLGLDNVFVNGVKPSYTSEEGNIPIDLTSDWKLYAVTFRTLTPVTRIGFGTYTATKTNAMFAMPKLELASNQENPAASVSSQWFISENDLKGEDAITLSCSPTAITIMRTADGKKYLGETTKSVKVTASNPFREIDPSTYTVTCTAEDYSTVMPVYGTDDNGNYIVYVYFLGDPQNVVDSVEVTFTDNATGASMGVLSIPIVVSERGFVGSAGAMILPHGKWNKDEAYKLDTDTEGNVIGKPCVYYKEDGAKEGQYFVLEKSIEGDSNTQEITTDNTEYWSPFTKIEYLFTSALMADFATFGGNNGAVFYDAYLFSQHGFDKYGNYVHYTEHEQDMFERDENGQVVLNDNGIAQLSGEFQPILLANFSDGTLSGQKITETLHRINQVGTSVDDMSVKYTNIIDPSQSYAVKLEYDSLNPEGRHSYTTFFPHFNAVKWNDVIKRYAEGWEPDGAKAVMLNAPSPQFESALNTFNAWEEQYLLGNATLPSEGFGYLLNALQTACSLTFAEPNLFDMYLYTKDENDEYVYHGDYQSYFYLNGKRAHLLLVEPGYQVVARSCRTNGVVQWYVENCSDFVEIDMSNIHINLCTKLINDGSGNLATRNQEIPIAGLLSKNVKCFASRNIARVLAYDKNLLEGKKLHIDYHYDGDETIYSENVDTYPEYIYVN